MFVVNEEVMVSWVIPATPDNIVNTDFGVTVRKPDGYSVYQAAAIGESGFVAPDVDNPGLVEYLITPDQKGVWTIALSAEVGGETIFYKSYWMRVSEPDTEVNQQLRIKNFSDLSEFTYDDSGSGGPAFDVTSEDVKAVDIAFNPRGTKMFMLGSDTDAIYQYTLTDKFEVSTASYDNVSFSIQSQDSSPKEMVFTLDGARLFVLGSYNDKVYQYSLTTPYDLSTISYDNTFLYIGNEVGLPLTLDFSRDGKSMFILDYFGSGINEYTMATGFDINTAAYSSVVLTLNVGNGDVEDIEFSPPGTKMFLTNSDTHSVQQYSLSKGFDLTTATYDDDVEFYVGDETLKINVVRFDPAGSKMYILDLSEKIFQYSAD